MSLHGYCTMMRCSKCYVGMLLYCICCRDHLILWDLNSGYIKGRIKTSFKESLFSNMDGNPQIMLTKEKTGLVMPWDRRTESQTAKRRRQEREVKRERDEQQLLEKEKFNSIDQYLLSGDEQVVVCSYFAHHLNVFSVVSEEHLHTLEDRWSLLSLRTAALTHTGGYLVVSNFSEAQHVSYLTLWDTQQGKVRKKLKNEPGICCIAVSDDACRVAFGIAGLNKLKVWEPFRRKHKTISGYRSLNLNWSSLLFVTEGGSKALLLAGEVSMWDLDIGTVLSVFTPDSKIQTLSLVDTNNSRLVLGFSDMPTLITMTVSKQEAQTKSSTACGKDLFGESSSSEEDEETNKNG